MPLPEEEATKKSGLTAVMPVVLDHIGCRRKKGFRKALRMGMLGPVTQNTGMG